jgi:hypothetical protein
MQAVAFSRSSLRFASLEYLAALVHYGTAGPFREGP